MENKVLCKDVLQIINEELIVAISDSTEANLPDKCRLDESRAIISAFIKHIQPRIIAEISSLYYDDFSQTAKIYSSFINSFLEACNKICPDEYQGA